jgi:predicted transcriptional regulator
MQRITTNVDGSVYARLEDLARRRDTSIARLIREAMERYVTDEEAALEPGPLPEWVGMLEGPGGVFAARDEEVLDERWSDAITGQVRPRTSRR